MPTVYTYTSQYLPSEQGVGKEKKIAGIIKKKTFDVCIHVMKPNVNSDLPTDFKVPCLEEESFKIKKVPKNSKETCGKCELLKVLQSKCKVLAQKKI